MGTYAGVWPTYFNGYTSTLRLSDKDKMKNNLGFRALLDVEEAAFDMLVSKVPCPEFRRAGTWTICKTCDKPYIEHPYIIPHYFLNQLCDGSVVKL